MNSQTSDVVKALDEIILTPPGERLASPHFGSRVWNIIFGSTLHMVIRMDDNGNNFLVEDHLTAYEADQLLESFHGHKQFYMKLAYTNAMGRHELFIEHRIIE